MSKKEILVVEDEESLLKLESLLLSTRGYNVRGVADGQDARRAGSGRRVPDLAARREELLAGAGDDFIHAVIIQISDNRGDTSDPGIRFTVYRLRPRPGKKGGYLKNKQLHNCILDECFHTHMTSLSLLIIYHNLHQASQKFTPFETAHFFLCRVL